MASTEQRMEKKKEIYTYDAPWCVYGLASAPVSATNRLAVGSYIEEYTNKIQLIEHSAETNALEKIGEFNHPYPATKIMWSPVKDGPSNCLATTADYLRIWKVGEDGAVEDPAALLRNDVLLTTLCVYLTNQSTYLPLFFILPLDSQSKS